MFPSNTAQSSAPTLVPTIHPLDFISEGDVLASFLCVELVNIRLPGSSEDKRRATDDARARGEGGHGMVFETANGRRFSLCFEDREITLPSGRVESYTPFLLLFTHHSQRTELATSYNPHLLSHAGPSSAFFLNRPCHGWHNYSDINLYSLIQSRTLGDFSRRHLLRQERQSASSEAHPTSSSDEVAAAEGPDATAQTSTPAAAAWRVDEDGLPIGPPEEWCEAVRPGRLDCDFSHTSPHYFPQNFVDQYLVPDTIVFVSRSFLSVSSPQLPGQ